MIISSRELNQRAGDKGGFASLFHKCTLFARGLQPRRCLMRPQRYTTVSVSIVGQLT
jgi:hypothetical protein